MNKILSDTRIAIKIIVPLIAIALVGLAGAAYSGWQMKHVDTAYSDLIAGEGVAAIKIVRVNLNLQVLGYQSYRVFVWDGASAEAHEAADKAKAADRAIVQQLKEIEALVPEWKTEIEPLRTSLTEIRALSARAVDRGLANDAAAGTAINRELDSKIAVLTPQIVAFNDAKIAARAAATAELTRHTQNTLLVTMTSLLVATVAAVLASLLITGKGIVGPTNVLIAHMRRLLGGDTGFEVAESVRKDEFGEMARAVVAFRDAAIEKTRLEAEGAVLRGQSDEERARNQRVADAAARDQAAVVAALGDGLDHLTRGDLTYTLNQPFPEDYVKLKDDFNAAIGQLKDTMSVVMTNVSAIRSGSGEISHAADDLSRRTEQQAASLEETAAALDEITATVNRTAAGARQAAETVQAAKGDAETSGIVVRDAVGAMGAIEKSAQEISQIIGVIDEIAFQTNLLALNAGVEAARAGDAGRGFAVVASEVRALAQRSAEAAKEIKVLISASTSQVNTGVALVGQTGEALRRIVSRVAEIDGLVSEIAASAQEQATGLQQVNTAVNQMDQVTQQNAAMVEESTAASHSLSQEAESLAGSVSRFKIGAPQASIAAPARASHAPSRPAHRPVTQMRTVGHGGAARKPAPVASENAWEEF